MLQDSITKLPGIGAERQKAFHRLGVDTIGDLLYYFPRGYEDRSTFIELSQIQEEKTVCVRATVFCAVKKNYARNGMVMCRTTVADDSGTMDVIWFNNPYVVNQLKVGKTYCFYGPVSTRLTGWQMHNPVFEPEGKQEITGGIVPIYPLTARLSQKQVLSAVKHALKQETVSEYLPESIRNDYHLCEINYAIQTAHCPPDFHALELAKKRLAFEEIFFFQFRLLYMKRQAQDKKAPKMQATKYAKEFLKVLPFTLTGAQRRAMLEVCADLESGHAMNRLVQGDVGCGKTVVAAAAVYAAVKNGYQAALMAPTEILAHQHYESFQQFFAGQDIVVECLTGSLSAKEKKEIIARLAAGEIDVLIGTHALIQKNVVFANLALVITDEQHRFGVAQRAALSQKGEHAHALVMSATPIPRTLSLILYGDLDLSVIDELPPGRKKVDTFAVGESYRERIHRFILKHVAEGRQVYIVCPLIEESEKSDLENATRLYQNLQEHVLRGYRVALLHGAMKPAQKDEIMTAFARGEIDVLVSTTVIEVGINVPNASLMIVENAERFGLSQLHQLRGRVGRGAHQSYCILIDKLQSEQSRERLKVLCQTNDGFAVSQADLTMRGSGDLLGKRQSGQMDFRMADIFADMALFQKVQQLVLDIETQKYSLTENEKKCLFHKIQHEIKNDISLN